MTHITETLHEHEDIPERIDRLDHFLRDLQALVDKYSKPERDIDLSVCEICSLEKAGKARLTRDLR